MNNKAKKPVLFLLCLTASLAALSACSKKTTKTTAKPTTTVKTTTTKKETTKKPPTGNPKVFFIVDGEIYQEVEYLPSTAAIVEPEIPQKAGYNIAKWSDYTLNGYDLYVFAMYFKSNTTYKVEYYLQNLDDDEYTLKAEDTQSFTTTPDKVITPDINTYDGFKCINAETEYMLDEDSSKNTIKIYYDRNKYDINIDLDNGSSPIEYNLKYGATIPTIDTPVKEGYTFDKFTVNGSDIDLTKPVSQSLDIKANYTANTNTAYTVKYYQENKYDDGYTLIEEDTENLSGTTDTDVSITVNPSKYAGFSINQDKTISSGIINGDGSLELSVYYNRNKYNVTYKYADGVTEDVTNVVKYGALANNLDVTRQGYTLKGWTNSETSSLFNFETKIEKDYTFIASYTPNSGIGYKVNVYYENANNSEYKLDNSYTYTATTGDKITVNPDNYENSYIFKYNEEMSNPTGIVLADGSLELNLYFKREVYTLRFLDRSNSELIKTVTIKHGQIPSEMPEEFVKAGYTIQSFADQTLGGSQSTYSELLEFIYSYSGSWGFNHDVKIAYTANSDTVYKIRIYYENIEDDNYTFIEELTCHGTTDASIIPEGIYNFIFDHASGYTEEDGAIIKGDGSTVIKAYYKRAKYNVSFITNIDGVELPDLLNVKYGTKIDKPILEKAGYTFDHWHNNSNNTEFDFTNDIIEVNTTLECYWNKNSNTKYTIKHYLQNIDDDEYTLYQENTCFGETESTEYYYDHKIEIEGAYYFSNSEYSININGDGSSVIEIYYNRNTISIDIYTDSHVIIDEEKTSTNCKYGAKFKLSTIFDNFLGYEFDGIYDYSDQLLTNNLEYEFDVNENISLYAKSKVKAEMEIFNFTSDTQNCVITSCKNPDLEEIIIPDYVTEIKKCTVHNTALKKVTIGKNVKTISEEAFYNCTELEEVIFESDSVLEEIESEAFFNSSIKSLTIPKSLKIIGTSAFQYSKIEQLYFEENSNLEEISNEAFCDNNILNLELPSSLKKIGYSAFYNALIVDELIIPSSVEEIGETAFSCSTIGELRFEENSNFSIITDQAFAYAYIDKVIISKDVTEIKEYAFYDAQIKELLFENGSSLETIGEYAFAGNNCLKYLALPENLKLIKEYAFNQYYTLSYVKVNSKLLDIENNAFNDSCPTIIFNYSDKTFVIGEDTYGSIALNASYIFTGDENDHILIDSEKGFVYKIVADTKELLAYIGKDKEVNIANGVTKICDKAFYYNSDIIKVTIPNTVTEIGNYAFYGCDNLASVDLGSGVTDILSEAFNGCTYLVEVNNKSSLEITKGSSENGYIGNYAINVTTDNNFESKVSYDSNYVKYEDGSDLYLIKYIGEQDIEELIIPNDFTIIYKNALHFNSIKKIVIGSGVKTISEYAFYNISTEEIEFAIGSCLEYIGAYAFFESSSLKNIIIPSSVKKIDEYAFNNCTSITSITFEENSELEEIGSYAFTGNVSLKKIILPDSLTIMEASAFSDCYSLEKVTIGANLTIISDYAFNGCSGLKNVIFASEALEEIGEGAFANCYALTEFEVGENVVLIKENAFDNDNIYSIYNKSSLTLTKGSEEHGKIALNALEIYTNIDDKKTYVLDDFVYYKQYDGEDVVDLYLIGYIGTSEDITIDKDVTVIGSSAFKDNTIIKNVTFEADSKLRKISRYAFSGCDFNIYEIPNTIEVIENDALSANNVVEKDGCYYYGNSSNPYLVLKSFADSSNITIDENCKIILDQVFTWNTFEEIIIPNSVTYIGDTAFYGSSIESITLSNNLTSINVSTFGNTTIGSIIIPENVKEIRDYAFYQSQIEEITFAANSKLKYIGESAFDSCYNLKQITLPAELEVIDEYAFRDCTALESVTFADGSILKEIRNHAFYNCSALTSISFPDSLEYIGDYAFYQCSLLEEIIFESSSSLIEIGICAFYNCNALTSVSFPDSLKYIGDYAFSECSSLEDITFSDDANIEEIGKNAFTNTNITTLQLPKSLKIINECAFYNLNLESISVSENSKLEVIGTEAFYDCNNLTTIDLFYANNLKEIGQYSFCNCNNLVEVILPEGLEIISASVFYQCYSNNLDNQILVLPKSLKTIEEDAFYAISGLDNIYYNGTLEDWLNIEMESYSSNPLNYAHINFYIKNDSGDVEMSFGKYSLLTDIVISNTIEKIKEYAFTNLKNIKTIFIPNTVTEIKGNSFNNISSIDTKYYYEGTYEEFQAIMTYNSGYPSYDNVYYYSEEEPTDTNHKYWHYVDGVITDYDEADTILHNLINQFEYYLLGAHYLDPNCTIYTEEGYDYDHGIVVGEDFMLTYNGLLSILSLAGKTDLYNMLSGLNLIDFMVRLNIESDKFIYSFNAEESDIKGYRLEIVDEKPALIKE